MTVPGSEVGKSTPMRNSGSAWRAFRPRNCGEPTNAAGAPGGICAAAPAVACSSGAGPLRRRWTRPAKCSTGCADPSAFARRFARNKRATSGAARHQAPGRILPCERPAADSICRQSPSATMPASSCIQQIIRLAQQKEVPPPAGGLLEDTISAIGAGAWCKALTICSHPRGAREAVEQWHEGRWPTGAINLSIIAMDGGTKPGPGSRPSKSVRGWAIGAAESYDNAEYQDQVESASLYLTAGTRNRSHFLRSGRGRGARRWIRNIESLHRSPVSSFNYAAGVNSTPPFYGARPTRDTTLDGRGSARGQGAGAWVCNRGELGQVASSALPRWRPRNCCRSQIQVRA